jgi:hypothetical protein
MGTVGRLADAELLGHVEMASMPSALAHLVVVAVAVH